MGTELCPRVSAPAVELELKSRVEYANHIKRESTQGKTMARIAQITDLHLDDFLAEYYHVDARHNLSIVLDHVLQNHIDGIVVTGDFGTTESGEWLFARLASLNLPCEFILGNHDKFEDYARLASLQEKNQTLGSVLYRIPGMGGLDIS